METTIKFNLNGADQSVTTESARTLLEVLREDLDLTGTKYGCGEGSCRSCVVLVDGRPKTACQTPISEIGGSEIVTIEGLANGDELHKVQQAFIAESAMQCGYCVPGMVLTAAALLESNPSPSREEIITFMNGNICRCCNYLNLINAVMRAAGTREEVPIS